MARRRPRARHPLLRALGAVLALVVAATGARMLVGLATLDSERAHASYPLSGHRLVIEGTGSASALRISAGQPGKVEVDRVVYHDLQRPKLTQRLDGDRLLLGVRCPGFIVVRCDASYELRVPAAIDIVVRNPSGDIRLTGVQGSVDLASDAGAVVVQGGSGTARLRSNDGSIRASGLRATDVEATSDSGRIAIELAVVPRQVAARSRDGDVQIVVPAGQQAYHVDASSHDGTVTTAVPVNSSSPARLSASSDSGNVVVRAAG